MVDCPSPPSHLDCADAAIVPFESGPCDRPFPDGSICIYCNDTGDPKKGCNGPTTEENPRCTGLTASPGERDVVRQPHFQIHFGDGQTDIHGNVGPMAGAASYHYVLIPSVLELDVCPCAPGNYCPSPGQGTGSKWLCRMFVVGSGDGGWRMLCNETTVCQDGEQCDQYDPRRISTALDPNHRPIFVHLTSGMPKPYCFTPFADVFCYSSRCEERTWDCIGGGGQESAPTGGQRARTLDRLFVAMDLKFSTDNDVYPHNNPHEIELKNAALHTYSVDRGDGEPLVDQLDGGVNGGATHSATTNFDHRNKSTWSHSEIFDDNNNGLGAIPAFPPVLGSSEAYSEYAGEPVPITCRAVQRKIDFPAHLTFHQTSITVHLHVERKFGSNRVRVFGDAFVWIELRVRLLAEAFDMAEELGFPLMGSVDDPFDLRVADPEDLSSEHPYERLVSLGPNRERVPRQITWRGLRMDRKHSRVLVDENDLSGRPSWDEGFGGINPGRCCDVLWAIHTVNIFGEINNGSEWAGDGKIVLKEQRYQGFMSFGVAALDPNEGDSVFCR